jgi:hypothetical protein
MGGTYSMNNSQDITYSFGQKTAEYRPIRRDVCKWSNIQIVIINRVGQFRVGHLAPNRDQTWVFF